jgi:tetratricopeptide (TPR) repeat protein
MLPAKVFVLWCCLAFASGYAATDDAAVHFRRGRALGESGEMTAAAREFREALRLNPHLPEAHYFLALTLIADPIDKLDWPQAAAECRLALADLPAYPEAAHLLGVALAAMGQRSEAIDQFQKALELRPTYPEAHLDLGMAFADEGQKDRAIAEFRQAVAERPRYAEAHQRLAKCLFEENKPGDALSELKAALSINPDLSDAHYLLARVFLALQNKEAAQLEFRQVAQLNNRRVLSTESTRLSNAGLDAMRGGDTAAALANLRQAVGKKPDSAIAHYNLGLILADSGNLDEGIVEVRKALSLAPSGDKMRPTLTRMLQRKGVTSAEPVLADTCQRHLDTGQSFAAHGDTLGAIGEYLRALSLEPSNRAARCALAKAWKQQGNAENAYLETQKLTWLPKQQ